MNTAVHPALAHWLRAAGAPARSSASWQATQDRLAGLAKGLDGLTLFQSAWQALDDVPWVSSASPRPRAAPMPGAAATAHAPAQSTLQTHLQAHLQAQPQADLQAHLQALLQMLTPATGAGAAAGQPGGVAAAAAAGRAQGAAAVSARQWAQQTAGGLQATGRGAASPQGLGAMRGMGQAAAQRSASGMLPAPPRQPAGPALSPIDAASAAARWLDRSTRAGLDLAFHSPLGQAVQASLAPQQASVIGWVAACCPQAASGGPGGIRGGPARLDSTSRRACTGGRRRGLDTPLDGCCAAPCGLAHHAARAGRAPARQYGARQAGAAHGRAAAGCRVVRW